MRHMHQNYLGCLLKTADSQAHLRPTVSEPRGQFSKTHKILGKMGRFSIRISAFNSMVDTRMDHLLS